MRYISIIAGCLLIAFLSTTCLKGEAYGASAEEAWRINCGAGDNYVDSSQNVWVKDEEFFSLYRWGYTGEDTHSGSTTNPIEGTSLQTVYQTNRRGNMAYKIDVPNGTYKVTLMFAETYWNEPGRRVFDIALNGVTLWTYVDIFAWAGGKDRAMNLCANVAVTNSNIDITFPAIRQDYPLICGIQVEAIDVSDDAFLDFIERKMFWFFWTDINSDTGLVKWGEDNWVGGNSNVSSIAGDGLALSIYTIGAERGWVSKYDAYQRVMKILNSFDSLLPNLHGFWYHYVYMDTGAATQASEVSTVDSAIFIMGALQAGEYFRNEYPDVPAKAEALYRRMDWSWFTNIAGGDPFQARFVNMGWKPQSDGYSYIIPSGKPEGGFYCNDWWNRYCETIFVDLLALGSPTHPIAYDAWRDMNRNWVDAFGYHFMQEPPLFTHQYHHLYFNLVDKRDAYADYFLNTQVATLANRQTCLEDPRYEPKRWGLTGCGGPPDGEYHAYGGYPGGSHDGTVAPAAPVVSLIFTKDESMEAIRYIFFKYKHMIWGLHGFCDSFNIQEDFRNQTMNTLNNGAMIVGIENYRTGLVMNKFMDSLYAKAALTAAGFAPTPQVTASSYQNDSLKPAYAYDGNMATRWSSSWSNAPQWLEVDFKSPRTFNKLTIYWENAYAKAYKIQISNNRINWTDIYSAASGDGGVDEVILPVVTTRYIRIYGTQRGTEWAYSIWEIAAENLTDSWILNMTDMKWRTNSAPYNSTGAAACQMILNYIREGAGQPLLAQDEIYRYAKAAGPYDGSELVPNQVDRALGHFDPYDYLVSNWADIYDTNPGGNPYQGYNFSVDTYNPGINSDAMRRYMRDICHWMAYTVTKQFYWDDGDLTARPNTPAAVPIYGSYNHWVVIKGCATDANPAPNPHSAPWNTPDFTVYGFWLKDPLITGIGQDVYATASECESNYFLPLDTNDEYHGLLLQVAEPPQRPSAARIEIPSPVADTANLEFVGLRVNTAKGHANAAKSLGAPAGGISSGISLPVIRKQGWRDLVDKRLLLDREAVAAFEGSRMGQAIFVRRLDPNGLDYYLVPFNKIIKGRLLASAVVMLDASDGYFKEATWTKNLEKLLKITKAEAFSLVVKRLLRRRDYRLIGKIRYPDIELAWQPNGCSLSPYKPFWKVTGGNYTWYVTQEGKVFESS